MSVPRMSFKSDRKREVTGRLVLLSLVAFFAVVFGANAVLVGAALSTFGGVTTQSPYKAGLYFEREIAAAHDQDAMHWRVDGRLARDAAGETTLWIEARDGSGSPIGDVELVARLVHPADARLDCVLDMHESAPGRFGGTTRAPAGQWDLVIDLLRDDRRLFRSKSRVTLR